MQLSTRGRYAVMAMAELARREATPPTRAQHGRAARSVTLAEIAAAQGLSLPYLEQLFCRLRRAGLLRAVRGPGGGYRLARAAAAVTIADIVLAAEEELRTTLCHAPPGCPAGGAAARCVTHDLWDALGGCIRGFLERVTLDDVIQGRLAPVPAQVAAE